MSTYIELHTHSFYSLLDGASSPEALLDRASALHMPALALTDHDNLYGAVRFWRAAKDRDIHPIIGTEITVSIPPSENNYHLTLLAENQTGYANLCRLLTSAHLGHSQSVDDKLQAASSKLQTPNRNPQSEILKKQLTTNSEQRTVNTTPNPQPSTPDDWPGKTSPRLSWDILNARRQGLIALSGCCQGAIAAPLLAGQAALARTNAEHLRRIFGPNNLCIELQRHLLPHEPPLIHELTTIARQLDLPLVATNNVHYAERAGQPLQDVMVCIQHLTSLDEAGGLLRPNSEFHLKSAEEMARLFPAQLEAIKNTLAIAERCQVSLDFSNYPSSDLANGYSGRGSLPAFPVPKEHTPFSYLYELCQKGLHRKFQPVTPAAGKQLAYELDIIERSGLAGYFLIVWDIVRFAGSQGIRYQGRGSAANSLVAYLLDITPVDPLRFHLLFDRFLSEDSHTTPDIDIDFAADRREEVIQYVYQRYGVEHTAMVCNINTFRARAALRDVGRALGLKPGMIDQIQRATRVDEGGRYGYKDIRLQKWQGNTPPVEPGLASHRYRQASSDSDSSRYDSADDVSKEDEAETAGSPHDLLLTLCEEIEGAPRHLSIHNGGMIITASPLNEIVPLERATMPGRVVTHWNKDSVEDAGLIKIDLLGLRTLGMIEEIAQSIETRTGVAAPLDNLPLDDPAIYDDLCKADTIGAFQVESRAQAQMLPRLRPRCFEDIVVEVAIIRPGPIQGNMVHPYLRRRQGLEPVAYPHPALEPALKETLGVVLFQEQVLRVAMIIAGFTGGEADQLRRAMSRQRPDEEMVKLAQRFVVGALQQGLSKEEAIEIFGQLAGFASYGFCKSHAAAFALVAYQTMWLKHYHPPDFYCALLNHQPMGFYAPSVIMGDARRHNVTLLPPDINRSEENCTLEGDDIRLGFRYVKGLGAAARGHLLTVRNDRRDSQPKSHYSDLVDLCKRTHLPGAVIEALIRAGVLDSLDPDRRKLLWELGTLDYRPRSLELDTELDPVALPELSEFERMGWHLDLLSMTPGDHIMRLYRHHLQAHGILSATDLNRCQDDEVVKIAGQVIIRQRPSTAKGHLFISLEDETGLSNLIIRPALYEKRREVLRYAPMLGAVGRLQREGEVRSILVFDAWSLD